MVCLASTALDLSKYENEATTNYASGEILRSFNFALEKRNGRQYLTFPYGQCFTGNSFNKLIEFDLVSREMALEYLTAIEMRLFQSIPAGKLRVTMFDPQDLGKNFSLFSTLGEHDERIISTRIWHELDRMKNKLYDLVNHISHVNQDCLKKMYTNIIEYNKAVGKNAEPLQALFVADFSNQFFDMECCRLLNQILSTGPICGVFCFIAGNHQSLRDGLGSDTLEKNEMFIFKHGQMISHLGDRKDIEMFPLSLPAPSENNIILQTINEGIRKAEKIVIDYNEVSNQLLEHPEKWFQRMPTTDGIKIPFAIEGANKIVEMGFGGIDRTQHHTIVSGAIGSGKSTFLHTFIMSILLNYSPEDVQIYLLDLKQGVEFKIYSDYQLPNFKVISTNTSAEYASVVMKHLCDEMAEIKSTIFKKDNITLIEEYNEKHPFNKISRKILIIDEFHEMFENLDDEISKECYHYLQQLVKQGRAWGLYVVLASQNLPVECEEIYTQMLNRVALQSTEEAAKRILTTGNEGISSLINMDVGRGIFNDKGGDKDANHIIRVAMFEKELLHTTLTKIKERQHVLKLDQLTEEDDKILVDINSLSDAKNHPLTLFCQKGKLPLQKSIGYPLYLAKSFSLEEEFKMKLFSEEGQNLLVVGPENNKPNRILGLSAMSILFNAIVMNNGILPSEPLITYFDFSNKRKRFGTYDILNELSACYQTQIRVFGKDTLMFGIDQLESEIRDGRFIRHFVIFSGLNRARKLLSGIHTFEKAPKERLISMLKEGPEKGVNFIIWANEPETYLEFYGESLDLFDYRIGYNIQEETFKRIFLSGTYVVTDDDNNAVSYSVDEGNKKVRIYDAPLKDYLDSFIEKVDGCLDEEDEYE